MGPAGIFYNKTEFVSDIIQLTRDKKFKNLFSCYGPHHPSIAIRHQQCRILNLIFALKEERILRNDSHIGIIGGSFSALMAAGVISLSSDAHCTLMFEGEELLPKLRVDVDIYLSPSLNNGPFGHRFDPRHANVIQPVFDWHGGTLEIVLEQWLREYKLLSQKGQISEISNHKVERRQISVTQTDREQLTIMNENGKSFRYDMLLDASGFEDNEPKLCVETGTYWTGSGLDPSDISNANILVSGNGDSGIIEGLRVSIEAFQHQELEEAFYCFQPIEHILTDQTVETEWLDVLYAEHGLEHIGVVHPYLVWWVNEKWYYDNNRGPHDWKPTVLIELFKKIESSFEGGMFPSVTIHGEVVTENLESLVWPSYQAQCEFVRVELDPLIENAVSENLFSLMAQDGVQQHVQDTLNHLGWVERRYNNKVYMNGLTSTYMTSEMSRNMIWIASLLHGLEGVEYFFGKISDIIGCCNANATVYFEDANSREFDRVIVRHGLNGERKNGGRIAKVIPDHFPFGDLFFETNFNEQKRFIEQIRTSRQGLL